MLVKASNVMLRPIWLFLYPVAMMLSFVVGTIQTLQSYLISYGLLSKNRALDLTRLQNLTIVVKSQEAYNTSSIVKFFRWLGNIGVKCIFLFDQDGVLKKSKKIILEELGDSTQWPLKASSAMLRVVWLSLHLVPIIWHYALDKVDTLQSYLISSGLLREYKALDLTQLQCLAIVVESQDAYDTSRIVKLLRWLADIGVKYICLYDMDGVLKKSKKIILEELGNSRPWHLENHEQESHLDLVQISSSSLPSSLTNGGLAKGQINLEFISLPDGKLGVTKAASFLCSEYLKVSDYGGKDKPVFTETNMAKALTAVGCGGPQPNLLLVYGPARCHLGFPAWRLRYTEIVHMGPLKSMKYGSLVKAIHKFAKVHQNYGT